jgi:hypothetical protein
LSFVWKKLSYEISNDCTEKEFSGDYDAPFSVILKSYKFAKAYHSSPSYQEDICGYSSTANFKASFLPITAKGLL